MATGKTLPAWDEYVKKAPKNTVTIPLPDGELVVGVPTAGQIKKLNEAQLNNDLDGALAALFGEEGSARVWDAAKDAPQQALQELISDTVAALGLSDDAGEGTASPN